MLKVKVNDFKLIVYQTSDISGKILKMDRGKTSFNAVHTAKVWWHLVA